MKKIIFLLTLGFSLNACGPTNSIKPSATTAPTAKPAVATKVQPPAVNNENITYAERLGAALYQAMLSADATDPYTSREADLINMSAGMHCKGNYKAVSVYDQTSNTENLYLILENPNPEYFQIGRHIRFRFKLGTNQLIDVTPSSKTCLAIPSSSNNSIPYVTHIMSNEPSEFHVFLSLYHHKTIYVGTQAGAWKVENGKVELLESK